MSSSGDFGPSASLEVLKRRATMLGWLREFFHDHGYWEVQTPLLCRDVCVDAWLEPFCVPVQSRSGTTVKKMFLQTSPEFAMKRLLASGAKAVYQITPAFRVGESGPLHNPEFTIVEWYRTDDTYYDQMAFTEELTVGFLKQAGELTGNTDDMVRFDRPFPRATYDKCFRDVFGQTVLDRPTDELRELAVSKSLAIPKSLSEEDRDGWLNFLLAETVEPRLAQQAGVFVHDYPASQAALARIRPDNPPVAERFELYLRGIEICNGYQELTDADELRRRIDGQSQLRANTGLPPLPTESRLLEAMDAGLPDCAGVALGFDRLLMIGLGLSTIDDVVAFPFQRS